ncbi:hypothetical protein GCM10017752_54940 [Streptomyces roseoviridis]
MQAVRVSAAAVISAKAAAVRVRGAPEAGGVGGLLFMAPGSPDTGQGEARAGRGERRAKRGQDEASAGRSEGRRGEGAGRGREGEGREGDQATLSGRAGA